MQQIFLHRYYLRYSIQPGLQHLRIIKQLMPWAKIVAIKYYFRYSRVNKMEKTKP
jgi:hypothetical protein